MTPTQTGELALVAELASDPQRLGEALSRALHAIGEVVPYDLAAVFRLQAGDTLKVVCAEGRLADSRVRNHSISLRRFPTVRRALEGRRPIALAEHDHSGEGDPYDGILDLDHGHSCMVVPLYAGSDTLGLITLDRSTCGVYDPQSVELAGIYGQLVGMALGFAEKARELQRYQVRLEERNRLLELELGGGTVAAARLEASSDAAMKGVVATAKQVAGADVPILIVGETGTGKEVLANAIHTWSDRSSEAFVKLNCASIPDNLVESELFGHVRGAFSGATKDREGRFSTANGGTLLLDEIGDLPLAAQAKLLRVLQYGSFEPVGSDRTQRVDVRIIAATHVDLNQAVQDGRFRQDLYYRIAVFPLNMPPLRERPDDVETIALAFLREREDARRGPWTLRESTVARLRAHAWPGNIRQLLNALERAIILQPVGELGPEHFGPDGLSPSSPKAGARFATYREAERSHMIEALRSTNGKIYGDDGAAQLLDLKPTTLQSKMRKLGIDTRNLRR